jgi:hypothetical protein
MIRVFLGRKPLPARRAMFKCPSVDITTSGFNFQQSLPIVGRAYLTLLTLRS